MPHPEEQDFYMFEECHISEHFPANALLVGLHRPVQRITSDFFTGSDAEIYQEQMFYQIPECIYCSRSDLLCHRISKHNSIGNEWQTWHLAFDMSPLAIQCLVPFCPEALGYLTWTIQLVSFRGQRDKPYVKKNKIICLCPFRTKEVNV